MTKAQIKAAIQGVINKVFDEEKNSYALKKLMDINEQFGDGHRWCSYNANLVGVIQGGNNQAITKALNIYEEACIRQGAIDVIHDIVDATNCLDF